MNQSSSQTVSQPSGLIDLHAHLVPGVDDGSASEKESFRMLQMAEADGIHSIVATPHLFSKLNTEKNVESLFKAVEEFLQKVKMFDFQIKVFPGAEIFFTTNLRAYFKEYQTMLTLNGSSYFILEFPFDFIFPGVRKFIYDIQMDGWTPIIAHPERNQVIQRNPRMLFEMVQQGALTQLNAGSLLGNFGGSARTTAFLLLQNNLVHVIASDAHSIKHRPPQLSSAYLLLKENKAEISDLVLKKTPQAILKNEAIPDIGDPIDPQRKLKFFDFIFRRKT